jgi:hypothetical protein
MTRPVESYSTLPSILKQLIRPMFWWIASFPCSQQRCQHRLQSPDQEIGFLVALQERRDLRIFHANLNAQKNILSFESRDILRHAGLWRALSLLRKARRGLRQALQQGTHCVCAHIFAGMVTSDRQSIVPATH